MNSFLDDVDLLQIHILNILSPQHATTVAMNSIDVRVLVDGNNHFLEAELVLDKQILFTFLHSLTAGNLGLDQIHNSLLNSIEIQVFLNSREILYLIGRQCKILAIFAKYSVKQ